MYKTKVLTTENKKWNELIEKLDKKDVYYLSEYLKAWEDEIGKPELFFFGNNNNFVIHVYFKRRINDLSFAHSLKEEYFDIVSPEYYSGPTIHIDGGNKKNIYLGFFKAFGEYCKKNNIICEFTRLHPFIKNYDDFGEVINTEKDYELVYIDLKKEISQIFAEFKKSNRNIINKAEREGVVIRKSRKKEDIKKFFEIYNKTMNRKNVKTQYFHSLDFFEDLLETLKDNSALYLAEYNGKVIAASIFLFGYGFFHYFRSGMVKEYSNLGASNLILYKVIKEGKEKGYNVFSLGGGNAANDGIFKFKQSFSKDTTFFYYYKKIHDQEIYKMLEKIYKEKENQIIEDFFPIYRSKI
ncbi:GNAT family N-acetyltransferase [Candidatus Woesearchaeota archaeon]|nr:GNAT family N-acetyltransferase [Candidatus Woesearchaeota archaeon]